MHTWKDIEERFDFYTESMKKRNRDVNDLLEVVEICKKRNRIINLLDEKRSTRNKIASQYKGVITDQQVLTQLESLKQEISEQEVIARNIDEEVEDLLLGIPNILAAEVPFGKTENDNQEIKKWGEIPQFHFTPKASYELGADLDILDIPRGVKIAGTRFYVLRKEGAMLERAIANFFLDEAAKNGYTEIFAPFIVNKEAMRGTGQLPKFKEDLFKIENKDFYLIPTAEVSITNLYQNEIIDEKELPFYFASYSSCFRSEAGSYGKDTKGILRVHQFQKVELVKYVIPENSMQELEHLTTCAEGLLEKLKLPYRRMLLCGGDTGFSSLKTFDLEVYLPSEVKYREISSCSNFGDFQARRGNTRYKNKEGKNNFIHTINGSGLAVGRTMIAILENYQQEDGSVLIPEVLQPYMRGLKVIQKKGLSK